MNKFLQKVAKIFLGLSMAAGVGVAIGAGRKDASPAHADSSPATFTVSSYASSHSWTGSGGGPYGQGSANALDIDANVSVYCTGTSNSGKYYTDWRMYQSESATVVVSAKSDSVKLTAITFTYGQSNGGCLHTSKASSVTAYYPTGTKKSLSSVSSVTAYVANTGTKTNGQARITSIVVEYTVTASKTVSSISVADNSGKSWYAGDTVAASDLTVTVNYSSGDPAVITNGTGVYFNSTHTQTTSAALAQGSNTVTVYYTDTYGSASNSVSISAAAAVSLSSIAITTAPTKTTYNEGEYFDTTGMVVTATYSDSNTANVTTSCTFTPSTSTALSTSDTSVTVSYTYKGVEKTASQTIKVNPVESVTFTAGTDLGSTTGNNSPDSMSKSGFTVSGTDAAFAAVSSGTYTYRIYASSTVTFSVSSGSLGKITIVRNGSYAYSLLTVTSGGGTWNDSTGVWTGESSSVTFSASAQFRANSFTLEKVSTAPVVELDSSSATSVSMLKGNTDTSVKVRVLNIETKTWSFTFDEGGNSGLSTSDYISVSAGAAVSDVHTLTITTKAIGSTVLHISVSGTACESTISVTVAAKPNILRVVQNRAANPLVDITSIELQNGGSARQFAKTNIYVEDTDENPIEIGTISDYVTVSRISGDDCISISGGEITGTSVGTAVVKFELKSLTSVYDTVTVSVIDDYKTTVNTITVINGAQVSQGEILEVSDHISTKTANTHFSSTMTIADNELLFSYTNSRAAGVVYSSFVFDVEDSTLDAGETETRTIYVFASFDENYAGTSFTAVIEVADRPVTGLIVDGVKKSNNDTVALSLPRNSSYDFNSHVTVNPANATESHDIIYTLTSGGTYVSLSNGVMSIGSKIGSSVATITAKPYAKQDFSITFSLTITREAMTITADLPASWTKASSLTSGDVVAIVYEGTSENHQLSGVSSNIGQYEDYDDAGTPSSSYVYTVGTGNAENSFTFSSGVSYLAYTSTATSKQNNLYTITSPLTTDELNQTSWTVTFDNGDADIVNVYNTGRHLQWNDGSPRFCCYNNGGQSAVQIYKLSGSVTEVTVTDALFNVVNAAMSLKDGSSTLYDLGLCNASGTSFNVSAWNTLGSSFTSSIISDNKLAYARANESGNEIEQFLAVYDYVIGKKESGYAAYASADDFLGRVASGKITASPRVNPLVNIIGNNTNTVAIIVIISMVSVTAIGGYFFLRKKEANNL